MASVVEQLRKAEARLAVLERQRKVTAVVPDPLAIFEAGGIRAEPWQREVLSSQAERLMLCCCRQAGKSSLAAALAVHEAMSHPGSLTLLISPTLRQSAELLRRCLDADHAVGGVAPADAETQLRLELQNGSRIVSLPGSNDSSIRGYSADLVVLDEAARVGDSLFYAALPMLSATRGRLVLLSSAYAKQGFFFLLWTEGGPEWQRVRLTGPECPHIAPEVLAEAKRTMPDSWYRREWLCEFMDADDQVFSFEEIEGIFVDGDGAWPDEQGGTADDFPLWSGDDD